MHPFATQIDGPVAVIGDVHGQAEKLLSLLDQLRNRHDFQQRWIVFIGDLVDRGPDPKAVLDIVTDLRREHRRTTAVCGNHDFAMAAALGLVPAPAYANWAGRWLDHYDAETTFGSYDVEFGDLQTLAACLPEPHGDMLARLPWCVEHERFLFVHAGLDPEMPFPVQRRILRQGDPSLTRPPWLCSQELVSADPPADCRQKVVSGHVYTPQVAFRKRRILIDTTGGRQGPLSCVLLPENKVVASSAESASTAETASWWKLWRR